MLHFLEISLDSGKSKEWNRNVFICLLTELLRILALCGGIRLTLRGLQFKKKKGCPVESVVGVSCARSWLDILQVSVSYANPWAEEWWAAVMESLRVRRLSEASLSYYFHALKDTGSSSQCAPGEIPETEEPGRRRSIGLHKWTQLDDLAALGSSNSSIWALKSLCRRSVSDA